MILLAEADIVLKLEEDEEEEAAAEVEEEEWYGYLHWGNTFSSHLLTYVTKWIRVFVISDSHVVDKNNNTPWKKIAVDIWNKTEGHLLSKTQCVMKMKKTIESDSK